MSGLPNTFQVFNFYIDRAMELLTDSEFRVLMYATRHILGWQDRIEDRQGHLSLTMFENGFTTKDGAHYAGCGLGRGTIINTIEQLVTFGFLKREGEPTAKGQKYTLLANSIGWGKLEDRRKERDEKNKKKTRTARSKKDEKKSGSVVAQTTLTGLLDNTGTGLLDNTMQGTVAQTTPGTVAQTESNTSSNPTDSNTSSNPTEQKTPATKVAPVSSKALKYPKSFRNWTTAHFCQYHSEHRNEIDVLTSAFFSNVPGGITIPMMTNGESIGPVKLHQSLHRLGFPIDLYPDLIQNTREMNLWKTNGISWEDVEKNVTAFRLKRKVNLQEESNTKDSLELENQKAYERIIARSNGAKLDAMGELIVEGVGTV